MVVVLIQELYPKRKASQVIALGKRIDLNSKP